MLHPFIGDLSALSMQEIQNKMNELTKRIAYVSQSGNNNLIHQLYLALQDYNEAYEIKSAEAFAATNDQHNNMMDKINIK